MLSPTEWRCGGYVRERFADIGAVGACWVFVAFLSTAQHWTGLDTPDSEFYATLGLFGDDVTDRAILPVYYWTRVGTIAPVRALTSLFGPWTGYYVFWLLLLAVIIGAVYLTSRRFTGRTVSAMLAGLVALNTVILGYLGNPYPTGTVFAATFVVIAGAVWTIPTDRVVGRGGRWLAPALSGIALGWLAMTNPYATLLSAIVWLAATMAVVTLVPVKRWAYLLRSASMVLAGAAASFGVLLFVSGVLFPGLDWLGTYRYWNSALNQADYIGDMFWFTRDISMVVPATIGIGLLAIAIAGHGEGALRVAPVLFPASAAFALGYLVVVPSNTLETPHYQSMQWPPVLAGLSLTVAAIVGRRQLGWPAGAVAGVGVVAAITAGHWVGTLPLTAGWLIAVLTSTLLVVAAVWDVRAGTRRSAVALLIAVVVVMASAQVLQNARRPLGVNAEDLYSNAYQQNDVESKLRSAHDAEAWLISRTTPNDKVMVWVDADWVNREQALLPMAAFQLWGANSVTQQRTLAGGELDYVKGWAPSVIALYGKSMDAVVSFWNGLPRELRGPAPECRDFAWPNAEVPTAYLCLTRPTWT